MTTPSVGKLPTRASPKSSIMPRTVLGLFIILGLEEGETTIRIKINHGDHTDFVSPEIEIHVSEGGPGEEHDEHDDEG